MGRDVSTRGFSRGAGWGTVRAMRWVVLSSVLLCAACSLGDDDGPSDSGLRDSGAGDAEVLADAAGAGGSGDAAGAGDSDAGTVASADAGAAACPEGSDGCACGEGCREGSQCLRVGPKVELCLRPCAAGCGAGQRCGSLGLSEDSGLAELCVDSEAGRDAYCSFSRRDDASRRVRGAIVGCAEGLECRFANLPGQALDDGVCVEVCEEAADCPAARPICNPTAMTGLSVCGDRPRGVGSVCRSPTEAAASLAERCDRRAGVEHTACVAGWGVLSEGFGVCLQSCALGEGCENSGLDDLPEAVCQTGVFGSRGVCSPRCDPVEAPCTSEGWAGAGQFCLDSGLVPGFSPSLCVDRLSPSLAAAEYAPDGLRRAGEACFGEGAAAGAFFRCPAGTVCRRVPGEAVAYCDPVCGEPGEVGSSTLSAARCEAYFGAAPGYCVSTSTQARPVCAR